MAIAGIVDLSSEEGPYVVELKKEVSVRKRYKMRYVSRFEN